ncbi:hypothetical protein [Halomontanus rarus]|uniref:hypothetical protein n=1 Tax=Halomontanus rarus TaxID=3034020 RepID=UPI001A9977EE
MKWRCAWCGKPHEENDPPCDSCGHGEFEEAVVRQKEFETVDTGTQYTWVCANCGRQHMRNNPPCSRCGGHDLEKTEQSFDDVEGELDVPSWLEVARPYAPIIVVLVLVAALFATGIVPLSAIPGIGTPSPPDAPGDSEQAAGLDLAVVEQEIHDRLEGERADRGVTERQFDDGLAAFVEYQNRQWVNAIVEGSDLENPPEAREFDPSCGGSEIKPVDPTSFPALSIDDYDDESTLAADIANGLLDGEFETLVFESSYPSEALDVHVADGSVFVYYAAC